MASFLSKPVEHLLKRLSLGQKRWIVGLAGTPGSGKSTLAARLSEAVNQLHGAGTMVALGMDGFHLPKAALLQLPDPEAAFVRRGAPWTFDVEELAARLSRIGSGREEVEWPKVMA